jgi:hypothetical protein
MDDDTGTIIRVPDLRERFERACQGTDLEALGPACAHIAQADADPTEPGADDGTAD